MIDTLALLEKHLGAGTVLHNEPLARFTTLKIGGPAEYFYVARTSKDIQKAFLAAQEAKIPFMVLGGGTNIVIADAGIKGLVVKNEAREIKIVRRLGQITNGKTDIRQVLVEADTGTLINQLVRFTCDEGLGGLERHLGLPGTAGGALYMNSKWTNPTSYVGDVLYQAKILQPEGSIKVVDNAYFDFGYDQSILQKTHETVLSAIFLLTTEDPKALWEKANASMDYRKKSQPMGIQTAGCTFRNIAAAHALRLGTPNHTTSVGYLIDQVGLKNYQVGKAKFSDKHANFIINTGGATAADVKALIDEAKLRVKERFDVDIEPEIVLLGKFD